MTTFTDSSDSNASDAELVATALRGDRNGFGRIIARYQALICSLAFSATGSLALSEELAQETFVAAWKRLRDLREPEKLRPWLCGIARNLANNSRRRRARDPLTDGGLRAENPEGVSPEPTPDQETIAREEAALLWESLEKIPETYRVPLILYYREQRSVRQVAELLDLSEDTAKQRLSRGRKLLHSQVLDLVASVLERSTPGRALTIGILAALPVYGATSTATAATLTAAGGHGLKAAGIAGTAWAIIGPLAGILGGVIGIKASLSQAESVRERRFIVRMVWWMCGLILVFITAQGGLMWLGFRLWRDRPHFVAGAMVVVCLLYLATLFAGILYFNRRQRTIRAEEGKGTGSVSARGRYGPIDYRSRIRFLGLPLLHVRSGSAGPRRQGPVTGWIAIGDVALGGLFASGGVAVAPIAFGGISIGLLGLGGVVLGAAVWGGLTVGFWAIGGVAAGFLAFGGVALAWEGAMGGWAVAREYALGGVVSATHANDAVATAMAEEEAFFGVAVHMSQWGWLAFVVLFLFIWRMFSYARRKNSRSD